MTSIDPQAKFRTGAVDMTHGGGGRAMSVLIEDLFHRHLKNTILDQGHDAAVLEVPPGRLVMSTDAHVISPLFFPGGDIGSLSVHGTLNDVAMAGARPLSLTASFILEEGFPLADLERIVISMARAAREAGVPVVSGDTKVVEKGRATGSSSRRPVLAFCRKASRFLPLRPSQVRRFFCPVPLAITVSPSCRNGKT